MFQACLPSEFLAGLIIEDHFLSSWLIFSICRYVDLLFLLNWNLTLE